MFHLQHSSYLVQNNFNILCEKICETSVKKRTDLHEKVGCKIRRQPEKTSGGFGMTADNQIHCETFHFVPFRLKTCMHVLYS